MCECVQKGHYKKKTTRPGSLYGLLFIHTFLVDQHFVFFAVLGFELRTYTLSHSASPVFIVLVFFKMGSHELFAWAGLNQDPPDLCLLSSSDYSLDKPPPNWIRAFDNVYAIHFSFFLLFLRFKPQFELRVLHLLGRRSTT
jgi:hypothetical protein